jgi:hypothetical protein
MKSWKFCLFLEQNGIVSLLTVESMFKTVKRYKIITNKPKLAEYQNKKNIKKKKKINPNDRPYFFFQQVTVNTYFFGLISVLFVF